MDCSSPCLSVHAILQVRILEWVATALSPGDLPHPGIKSTSPAFPALQVDSSPRALPPGSPIKCCIRNKEGRNLYIGDGACSFKSDD